MVDRTRRTVTTVAAAASAACLVLTGCGSRPADESPGSAPASSWRHQTPDASAGLLSRDDLGADYLPSDEGWTLSDDGQGLDCLADRLEDTDPVHRAETTYSPGEPDRPAVYSAVEVYARPADLRATMAAFRSRLAECERATRDADGAWALSVDVGTGESATPAGVDDRTLVTATARLTLGDVTLVRAGLALSLTAVGDRLAVVGVAALGHPRSTLLDRLTRQATSRLGLATAAEH